MLAVAITAVISSWLWVSTIGAAGSGPVSLIENSQTLFAFAIGVLFLGEKMSRRELLAGGLILVGVILVGMLRGEVPPWAAVAATVSAFIFAGQSFLIKKYGAGMHSATFSYLRTIILAIVFTTLAWMTGDFILPVWRVIVGIGGIYILGALVARYFFFESHKYLPISQINLLILIVPVLVVAGTVVLFGDTISLQKIIGAVLALGGTAWFVRERAKILKKDTI